MTDQDRCPMCRDDYGWVLVLPETATAWETWARCPHSAAGLLDVKRRAEYERARR
ncbi:hypothetical protein [Mycolicibacterium austroafricanum]|uniref:hypothetical protein n=1 Tax=Mycolicibacterium austroafricanum TaxID=39687 RepID=UPI001CA33B92|nr:hypothetical protein [Mycolicibacterium austroafricanum]QZT60933.1 hypothetical protein JN085_18185 [Mycolicibacterium austroafricanum]